MKIAVGESYPIYFGDSQQVLGYITIEEIDRASSTTYFTMSLHEGVKDLNPALRQTAYMPKPEAYIERVYRNPIGTIMFAWIWD